MMNTKFVIKQHNKDICTFFLMYLCNILLFWGLIKFIYDTPIGQSINPTISCILLYSWGFYVVIFGPMLISKYLLNKRSKFIKEHSDELEKLVKDVLPYSYELCILVLYDGDDYREALKNNALEIIKTPLTPKLEKMMKESEKKRLDEEDENGKSNIKSTP